MAEKQRTDIDARLPEELLAKARGA